MIADEWYRSGTAKAPESSMISAAQYIADAVKKLRKSRESKGMETYSYIVDGIYQGDIEADSPKQAAKEAVFTEGMEMRTIGYGTHTVSVDDGKEVVWFRIGFQPAIRVMD